MYIEAVTAHDSHVISEAISQPQFWQVLMILVRQFARWRNFASTAVEYLSSIQTCHLRTLRAIGIYCALTTLATLISNHALNQF